MKISICMARPRERLLTRTDWLASLEKRIPITGRVSSKHGRAHQRRVGRMVVDASARGGCTFSLDRPRLPGQASSTFICWLAITAGFPTRLCWMPSRLAQSAGRAPAQCRFHSPQCCHRGSGCRGRCLVAPDTAEARLATGSGSACGSQLPAIAGYRLTHHYRRRFLDSADILTEIVSPAADLVADPSRAYSVRSIIARLAGRAKMKAHSCRLGPARIMRQSQTPTTPMAGSPAVSI